MVPVSSGGVDASVMTRIGGTTPVLVRGGRPPVIVLPACRDVVALDGLGRTALDWVRRRIAVTQRSGENVRDHASSDAGLDNDDASPTIMAIGGQVIHLDFGNHQP